MPDGDGAMPNGGRTLISIRNLRGVMLGLNFHGD